MDRLATSALSALLLSFLTALTLALSFAAMAPQAAASALATLVVGTALLWPFAFGAHAIATRWLGVTPTPLLDAMVGRGGLRYAALRVPLGGLYAVPAAALGLGLVAFIPYEVNSPEGVPFAGLSAAATLVANLQVVVEEIIFRLVLFFPLIALLGARRVSRLRWPWQLWAAILVTDVLFALAHLGIAAQIGMDARDYLVVSLVQKGLVAGTIFGVVAWRYGLEAAVYAHYTHNVLIMLVAALLP